MQGGRMPKPVRMRSKGLRKRRLLSLGETMSNETKADFMPDPPTCPECGAILQRIDEVDHSAIVCAKCDYIARSWTQDNTAKWPGQYR